MTEAQLSVCKTCLNRKKGVFDAQDICNVRGLRLKPEEECSYYEKDTRVITATEDKQLYIKPNADRAKYAIIAILVVMCINIVASVSSYFQWQLLLDYKNGMALTDELSSANNLRQEIIRFVFLIAFITSIVFFILWFRRAYYNLQVRTGNCRHSDGWAAGSWFVPIICLYRPYQIMKELAEETTSLLSIASGKEVKSDSDVISIWWVLWIFTNYIVKYGMNWAFKGESIDNLINGTLLAIANNLLGIPLAIITVFMIKKYAAKETALTQEEKNSEFIL
ncbi:MAG: DUF4328 domain-containing protein [Flavobacterium sp.]|uniref:DUF4328 domain-containing protein n=1 Tax=Flavobacterium sp. TaxID=239 RepID=UPI0022C759E7|nr:DUF4328 domain-containing protein [Flavobacterium sp.]MCZ8198189.1 DUF4328 domain-containing protein [Flavobacterium sp.]